VFYTRFPSFILIDRVRDEIKLKEILGRNEKDFIYIDDALYFERQRYGG
jgi:hypothetical protein